LTVFFDYISHVPHAGCVRTRSSAGKTKARNAEEFKRGSGVRISSELRAGEPGERNTEESQYKYI
jgi:hypothetical protein